MGKDQEHTRIQEFSSEGVQARLTKKSSDNVFLFLVLSLFLEVKWSISKKYIIFQGSRGGPTFSRGVQLFSGGSNCLFPIEIHITCDFQGGGSGPPVPPPSGSALEESIQSSTTSDPGYQWESNKLTIRHHN